MTRKPKKLPMLDDLSSADQEVVRQLALAGGSFPIADLKVGGIGRDLSQYVTIDWPKSAVVTNGFSQSTPVVNFTAEGLELIERSALALKQDRAPRLRC